MRSRTVRALLTTMALTGVLVLSPSVSSATAYRYWTYWTGTGSTWTFSQVGPASAVPKDGGVEGWRFALSTGTRGGDSQPRISPGAAFEQFCGDRTARSDQKRVAVVFDFGDGSEAPEGQQPPSPRGACSVVARGATGGQVLAEVADVRVEGGLVCGIGGYPVGECAPAVAAPTQPPHADNGPDRSDSHGAGRGSSPATTPPPKPSSGDSGQTPSGQDNGTDPSPAPQDQGAKPKPKHSEAARGSETGVGVAAAAGVPIGTASAPNAPSPSPTITFTTEDARMPDSGTPWLWIFAAAACIAALTGWIVIRARRD